MATATVVLPEVPHRIDKVLVTSALEKLGTDRVLRGHVSLEHGKGGDWRSCFLAMCFGNYGVLDHLLIQNKEHEDAALQLGLSFQETWAVTEAFDHCRAEFQVLVEEWLELNKNPALVLRDLAIQAYGRENVDLESFARAAAYCDQPEIKMQLAGVR
jgi:hypothetical protein